MATAGNTGPNLAPAVKAVEALMDDRCEITVDPEQERDDVLDRTTGLLTRPDPDDLYVYQGKCTLTADTAYSEQNVAGRPTPVRHYQMTIPSGAPPIPVGACVRMTASRRDPRVVDAKFYVTGTTVSTFSVSQRLDLERTVNP